LTSKEIDKIQLEKILGSPIRIKILKELSAELELNKTEIVRRTNNNNKTISFHLKCLIDLNVLQEKRFGRVKIYRLKTEHGKIQELQDFLLRLNKEDNYNETKI